MAESLQQVLHINGNWTNDVAPRLHKCQRNRMLAIMLAKFTGRLVDLYGEVQIACSVS